jgi:hypothetical protein
MDPLTLITLDRMSQAALRADVERLKAENDRLKI